MGDENRLRPDWQPGSCEDVWTRQDHQERAIRVLIMVPEAIARRIQLDIEGHVPYSMAV